MTVESRALIKKDIRNNPIVREVDLERHRDMWRSVAFSVLFVAVLLFMAWQQFSLQQHDAGSSSAAERADAELVNRSASRDRDAQAPARIEDQAKRQLRMVAPTLEDSTVISA
jgi:hypothetical protein